LKSKEVSSNGVKYSATYRNEKGRFESAQVIEYKDENDQSHRAVYLKDRNIWVDSFTPKDH
jgi:hypothetical protein